MYGGFIDRILAEPRRELRKRYGDQQIPLWARLISYREREGLSRPALADLLGVSASSVWRWETLERDTIREDVLEAWARACNTTFEELVSGAGQSVTSAYRAAMTYDRERAQMILSRLM